MFIIIFNKSNLQYPSATFALAHHAWVTQISLYKSGILLCYQYFPRQCSKLFASSTRLLLINFCGYTSKTPLDLELFSLTLYFPLSFIFIFIFFSILIQYSFVPNCTREIKQNAPRGKSYNLNPPTKQHKSCILGYNGTKLFSISKNFIF